MAFKYTFLQLSASSVVPPLLAHLPPPTQFSVPTGDAAKANSSEEVSLSFQCERNGDGCPIWACEAIGCIGGGGGFDSMTMLCL